MHVPEFMVPELDDETLTRMSAAIVHCMNFKSGESTLITGGLHAWKLIEKIRFECARKGVSSIVEATSDAYMRGYLQQMPTEFVRKPSQEIMGVASSAAAYIKILKEWDPAALRGLSKENLIAQAEAQKEIERALDKNGARKLLVGYPSTPLARSFNISFEELKDLVVGGMLVDQKQLLSKCETLAKYLRGAARVHLEDANGTDLQLHIRDRRISMSDGLISEEDQSIGYNTANLPTGEVFTAAHEDVGDGRLFCPLTRDRFTNILIRNATLVFRKGRLVIEECTAEEGEEELKDSLKSALKSDEQKYDVVRTLNIGELGLGLNEKITKPIGYILTDEKIGGSAHVAIGDNKSYGGTSESALHWDFVTGTKENVTVIYPDGSEKRIVAEGRIIAP